MAKHNILGQKGEDVAIEHLRLLGYKILARNWRYHHYEIDIIAEDDEFIIFVEVKTRASDMWGNPEDAVSTSKMKRIIEAADYYIREHDIDLPVRFDIISIIINQDGTSIDHIDDAFLPFI